MVERERVRVKGGPTGLPKFFSEVIVGDGLGYSSFGGSDAFSVPSAVGWWAREFCAVGGASSLWIALSSSSVELGGSAFGVADFPAPPTQEVPLVPPLAMSPPRKHHPNAKSHPPPQSLPSKKSVTDRAYPRSTQSAKLNPPQPARCAQRIEEILPGNFRADHSTPPTKSTVKSRSEITEARKKVQVGGYPGKPVVKA